MKPPQWPKSMPVCSVSQSVHHSLRLLSQLVKTRSSRALAMRPGKNKKQYQLQALVDLPYKVTNNSCLACEQRGDRTVNLRPLCSTPKVTYNDQNTLTMRILIMEMVTNPGHPSLQTFGPFPRTLSPLELNFQRIRDSGPDRPQKTSTAAQPNHQLSWSVRWAPAVAHGSWHPWGRSFPEPWPSHSKSPSFPCQAPSSLPSCIKLLLQ